MMRRLLYKVLDAHIWALSHLPLWMLHGLSDLIWPTLYYVVRYRRGVVEKNLRESFPEMTPKQLRSTARRFYRHLTDLVVETVKLDHISDGQLRQRMTFSGLEHIDDAIDRGQSVACYFSHCGCWEWAPAVTLATKYPPSEVDYCQVYRPLRNAWADALMLRLRSRCGSHSLPKATTLRGLLTIRKQGRRSVTGFMSDQHPSHGDPGHITTLLNHPTAMITGTETLARKLHLTAVYWDMRQISRGHYHIDIIPLAQDAADTQPGQLTEAYTRLLETTIRRQPSQWLWSHKRWKHPVAMRNA